MLPPLLCSAYRRQQVAAISEFGCQVQAIAFQVESFKPDHVWVLQRGQRLQAVECLCVSSINSFSCQVQAVAFQILSLKVYHVWVLQRSLRLLRVREGVRTCMDHANAKFHPNAAIAGDDAQLLRFNH